MHLDLLFLILFPLCLLLHFNTFFPLIELLFITWCLLPGSLSQSKRRDALGRGPSPLGSRSLVSPLQWCLAGCHPVPHLAPQTWACSQSAASLLSKGRGAAGVAPVCQHIPTPRLTFNHQEKEVVTPLRLWAYLLLPTATGCSVPVMGKGRDTRSSHTLLTPRVQSLPWIPWHLSLHLNLLHSPWFPSNSRAHFCPNANTAICSLPSTVLTAYSYTFISLILIISQQGGASLIPICW